MGLPGWATTLPTVKADLTLLPRNCRWDSDPNGIVSDENTNVTTGGERYTTLFFERIVMEFIFRFPQDENSYFEALYRAARAEDIYYVPDSDDMSTVFLVRGEDPNYRPRNIGGPGAFAGSMQMWFDWTFVCSTAAESVMIDD